MYPVSFSEYSLNISINSSALSLSLDYRKWIQSINIIERGLLKDNRLKQNSKKKQIKKQHMLI